MYTIDERLRGLPAVKEQVVVLYQSLNQPNLAIPGRKAGPATATVLGLRGPAGFAVFVYLYMPQSGEVAIYVPSNGTVPAELFASEESEALGFVESMGFMMDNVNFRGRPVEEQDSIIRSMHVFQREPPPPGGGSAAAASTQAPASRGAAAGAGAVVKLGKLFSAFCLALLWGGCAHVDERAREQSQLRYELALQNLVKAPQAAFKDVEEALALNPENADAWHVKGILLHNAFNKLEDAQAAYGKALEYRPAFPDARLNRGNLYMAQKRYDEAIAEYEAATADVTFRDLSLAHGNMGWAHFKKGQHREALEHLKTATSMNGKYCLGYLQLGQVYESLGGAADACKYFGRYREHCPDRPDAWQREGVCLAGAGDVPGAQKAFDTCVEKAAGNDDQRDLCKELKGQLAP